VPWTSKAQRLFDESHLPGPDEKMALYLKGKELLLQGGYADVGMDHFALPHDELYVAKKEGKLHRNFMGYTTQPSGLLLGLGVSSISDVGTAYAQNEKTVHDYYAAIHAGRLAVRKGYVLSKEDAAIKKYIQDIACNGRTLLHEAHLPLLKEYAFPILKTMAADGLVEWNEKEVTVTSTGHYFIRNICSAFDLYLKQTAEKPLFSKAI
jgi:oxygen-independent coproporphyrinogen-3 oxidase